VGVPTIVLGELLAGFLAGDQPTRNADELSSFLSHPVVEEVVVDHEIARTYAEIAVSLRSAGTPLPTNDVWIAACAARVGAPLLTFDEHFREIGRIGTILLRPDST
jgi:tRNA(fMet)-specific endonuclease VapC